MAFGFPAYADGSRRYGLSLDVLREAVARALYELDWTGCGNWSGRVFVADVRVNFWSWGEKITIEIDRDGMVWIESKCSLPTQCFDWGKNQGNVDAFFRTLDEKVRLMENRTDE